MEGRGSGNGPDARKVHSRSNSDDSDDVNDTAYSLSTIPPVQTIYSDSADIGYGDHCYHRRSGNQYPPSRVLHHENGGKSDNSENSSEKNEDESLNSSENGYEGPSEVCDYIRDLGFYDDRACVNDNDDAKDENEVVVEVADEGNNDGEDNNDSEDNNGSEDSDDSEDNNDSEDNDGEDNNEEQRHPFIRFLERSNLFIRNIINRTFDFPPPTPRYYE